ncbi:hypothetical protein CCR75_006446 [Bremia lactucae]|uniref:Uncharacterized protein n=1 Tax=Bremia lactucae TaxID=4779 RepID=A0A976FNP1_BRELC|nr:hypothetical protein CCR75_006446 [Bremia lactucae]
MDQLVRAKRVEVEEDKRGIQSQVTQRQELRCEAQFEASIGERLNNFRSKLSTKMRLSGAIKLVKTSKIRFGIARERSRSTPKDDAIAKQSKLKSTKRR